MFKSPALKCEINRVHSKRKTWKAALRVDWGLYVFECPNTPPCPEWVSEVSVP